MEKEKLHTTTCKRQLRPTASPSFIQDVKRNSNPASHIDEFEELPIFGNFDMKFKAMGRNTSVSLGNYFEDFVENRILEGRYKNASEVIRAGLRLLEEEENKVQALKNAVQEGIESGIAKDFDAKSHLEMLKARKRKNG
ncbi:type II toxin-antitoxin system ParD family antitoxin [Pontibacter russatus]|uniref:type II toxin-antitoxin system ParD family antitoxin n=1 Tax=Pontibacter russatus TaxID=2694929 RepID=UPI001F00D930|nr:type II toxin-antitoxin system ParD family antitoxin [Pontibacter russatus]